MGCKDHARTCQTRRTLEYIMVFQKHIRAKHWHFCKRRQSEVEEIKELPGSRVQGLGAISLNPLQVSWTKSLSRAREARQA